MIDLAPEFITYVYWVKNAHNQHKYENTLREEQTKQSKLPDDSSLLLYVHIIHISPSAKKLTDVSSLIFDE